MIADEVEYFRFEGDFAAVRIDWLTTEVRQKMETVPVAPKARARLFASFVEMVQNILHYAEPEPQAGRRRAGSIAFGRDPDGYWVSSRNPVRSAHAERLEARLRRLQSMAPDEVTAEFRERLAAGKPPDPLSRGAGLGLLSLARSTRGALQYRLDPPGPGEGARYTFSLRASVRAPEAA